MQLRAQVKICMLKPDHYLAIAEMKYAKTLNMYLLGNLERSVLKRMVSLSYLGYITCK